MCVLVMSYMFMLPVSTTADEDVYHWNTEETKIISNSEWIQATQKAMQHKQAFEKTQMEKEQMQIIQINYEKQRHEEWRIIVADHNASRLDNTDQ